MSSLIRTYVRKTFFGNEIQIFVNLKHISSIEQDKSTVKLNFATENDGVFGLFFAITGGTTRSLRINCDTSEGAKEEVKEIKNVLDSYYKITDTTSEKN